MAKLTIFITEAVMEALRQLAQNELRDPRAQAYYILQEHLEIKGFLTTKGVTNPPTGTVLITEDEKGNKNGFETFTS